MNSKLSIGDKNVLLNLSENPISGKPNKKPKVASTVTRVTKSGPMPLQDIGTAPLNAGTPRPLAKTTGSANRENSPPVSDVEMAEAGAVTPRTEARLLQDTPAGKKKRGSSRSRKSHVLKGDWGEMMDVEQPL